MRRLPIVAIAGILAWVAAMASPAYAAYFPGEPIDAARSVGDLDIARDGTGGVVYLKRIGGVDHVFVSRFVGGRFQTPERMDSAFASFSSDPVIAAAPDGRLAIAFSNGGYVHGIVRPAGKGYFGPTALGDGHSPSADMSGHGVGMVSFTSNGKDVRVARLDRLSNRWMLLPQVADIQRGAAAGSGSGRSKVAVAADGVGLVTWGESGKVYARKIFNTGLSTSPQSLTPASVGGKASIGSDLPDVDIEEDSSLGWVVFRQVVSGGTARILARRQRGTQFDPPVLVDVGTESAMTPRIDLNPRGFGIAVSATTTTRQPMVSVIGNRDTFGPPAKVFFGSTVAPTPTIGMAENRDGLVATVLGGLGQPPWVRVRPYLDGVAQPEVNLSRSQFGGVTPGAGLETAGDSSSDFVVTWIQAGKLMAGYQDTPPSNFSGSTRSRCCVAARATLRWRRSTDVWGPMRYEVYVDGKLAATTSNLSAKLAKPLKGIKHNWQVIGTDVRGQANRTAIRSLTVDDLPPRQRVKYSRAGRSVHLVVRGKDRKRKGHRVSGISGAAVVWGDGKKRSRRGAVTRFSHRYRRAGTYRLKITTLDKAGNQVVRKRTVRVR